MLSVDRPLVDSFQVVRAGSRTTSKARILSDSDSRRRTGLREQSGRCEGCAALLDGGIGPRAEAFGAPHREACYGLVTAGGRGHGEKSEDSEFEVSMVKPPRAHGGCLGIRSL